MAWRLYPDKDHPRWQIADGCGCGCGCYSSEDPSPTPKSAKRKPAKKARKPKGR